MSQKSSVPQSPKSVSQVLTWDSGVVWIETDELSRAAATNGYNRREAASAMSGGARGRVLEKGIARAPGDEGFVK